jgi:hypothetical protein
MVKTGTEVTESSDIKQYFINDANFILLKNYQQSIFQSTELSPAIRKIVNELITVENLEKVKEKFMKMYL